MFSKFTAFRVRLALQAVEHGGVAYEETPLTAVNPTCPVPLMSGNLPSLTRHQLWETVCSQLCRTGKFLFSLEHAWLSP